MPVEGRGQCGGAWCCFHGGGKQCFTRPPLHLGHSKMEHLQMLRHGRGWHRGQGANAGAGGHCTWPQPSGKLIGKSIKAAVFLKILYGRDALPNPHFHIGQLPPLKRLNRMSWSGLLISLLLYTKQGLWNVLGDLPARSALCFA